MAYDILIIGAGRIGTVIADLLNATGDYAVTLADRAAGPLADAQSAGHRTVLIEDGDATALARAMAGCFAVISAVPFHATAEIARAAVAAGVHYLDLTEDVATTRMVKELAGQAATALIPQCGLAPGFISMVAQDLIQGFDSIDCVRLRTGALPRFPANALGYNLTWSTEGVINEYCEPCEAIADGHQVIVPALEECEEFALDGIRYEAFNTSGGLGTLCESLRGKVRVLNYRSIRYPGHAAIMKTLLRDLRLSERRGMLKSILQYALPATLQDVVVIFVTVSGQRRGQLVQDSYAAKIYGRHLAGAPRSAIQITTAAGLCGVLDLLADNVIPARGLIRQEDIQLADFLANRFGRLFREATPSTSTATPGVLVAAAV